MKKDIGVHDNLFGGLMMSWLDEAGAAFVAQSIDYPRVVTLKISEVLFKEPVKVGQLLKIYGEVVKIGNTSITVRLEARRHKPHSGQQKIACSVEMVFVKIDEYGEASDIGDRIRKRFEK
jgi:acyl-CoA thioesterase YciA